MTLSAPEELIERARLHARCEKKTLNALFREWLERYAGAATGPQEYKHLMSSLSHVRTKRSFTREEMNAT